MNLFREIHRRSIWQVLGIYLGASWVVLQIVDTMAGALSLPEWAPSLALFLLVIGLPMVLATAFVQGGLRDGKPASQSSPADAQADVALEPSAAPAGMAHLLTWRNAALGGVGALALWGVIAGVMMATGVGPTGGDRPSAAGDRISIAVLPFSSAGDDDQSQIFSLGIHDDLLTRLSKIGSLRVTSRTSVMEYREGTKSIPEIADELGVEYVLEGSVLSAGGQVNINAQLIDARTDDHLWAETYNRALSVTNVFTIQKDLAQRITESLSATLLPEEVAAIETPPTQNLEAYNFFLRGHTYFQEGPRSYDFELSIEMYERAVELDPDFAEAHARLALALGMQYEVQPVGEQQMLDRALAAAERAFELAPDLPETNLALGQYYYTGERNLDLALEHLTRAGQNNLHSAELFHLLGAVQRRKGDLDGAIASFEELVRIDPLSAHFYDDLGGTYGAAARWDEAEAALRRSMALAPRSLAAFYALSLVHASRGDVVAARAVLLEPEEEVLFPYVRWQLDLMTRDFDAAAAHDVGDPYFPAFALDLKGDVAAARPYLDSARVEAERDIEDEPGQALPHAILGYIYAMLGRRDDAVRESSRAVELLPTSVDFFDGPDMVWLKVLTHARLGEVGAALDDLEALVANQPPGHYTTPILELHPGLDPLRSDPRFAELLRAYPTPNVATR